MMQHFAAAMLAKRQIERDAVEDGLPHKLDGFVTGRRPGREVAGLGRGTADDHAVKIVVVDDEQPRRRSFHCSGGGQTASVQPVQVRLFEHPNPARSSGSYRYDW